MEVFEVGGGRKRDLIEAADTKEIPNVCSGHGEKRNDDGSQSEAQNAGNALETRHPAPPPIGSAQGDGAAVAAGVSTPSIRVKNILICVSVAFCASSKIAKEFFKVLPLINARGAISISPISIIL